MKLDIGCGKNKKEGFFGIDQYKMEGVDAIIDCRLDTWVVVKEDDLINKDVPLVATGNGDDVGEAYLIASESVDEVHCSHFLEHLTQHERMRFMNELFRVLKPGGKATIITPHWASNRAYGDMTHQWPPVAEMFYYYLKQEWRDTQAPHTDRKWNPMGFTCDFDATWGYSFSPELGLKNQEYVQFALGNFKEAAQDLHATLVKTVRIPPAAE